MVSRILDWLFAKRVIVNCEHDPYLHRWFIIRRERFALFIHRFVRGDEDRALHDHPWHFIVIPVWRGYIEHNDAGARRVWPILGVRFRRATYRHRVQLIDGKPAWSLFIRFKHLREWGFWPSEGFILWNKWWQDKCE
jgi:hypothetical protein